MPQTQNRAVMVWLFLFAGIVAFLMVFGAFVRLTRSGLSITEWNPISGTLPPLSEQAWLEEFTKYQQTPEFQQVNFNMDLLECPVRRHRPGRCGQGGGVRPGTGRELPVVAGEEGVMDLSRRLGNRLGVLPHTVLLDGQGRVLEFRIGIYAEAALESRLAAITGK